MTMRIIFMGTPAFAVPTLERLAKDGHELLVVTQPARPAGRGLRLEPSAVRTAAAALALEVIELETLRGADHVAGLAAFKPDLLVVACFGLILGRSVLELPRLMPINLHPSLLPRHRGAAPIQWTLLAGDHETGVTTMRMDEGIDTGDILLVERTPVGSRENAIELAQRLSLIGAELMARTVDAAARGVLEPRPQGEAGATYAPRLAKRDGHLDWRRPAVALERQVRAVAGWPGARAQLGHEVVEIVRAEVVETTAPPPAEERLAPGMVIAIDERGMEVATGDGRLRLTELKPAGKGWMSPAAWARGRRVPVGSQWEMLEGGEP
jgi:methionyl-tRNA formyltransferase